MVRIIRLHDTTERSIARHAQFCFLEQGEEILLNEVIELKNSEIN